MIILFFVLMMFVLRDSNLCVNNSRMDVLEERCGKIAKSTDEITRIINALSINSDINRVMSQKSKAEQYDYIMNNRIIQDKMLEITELFYNRQYQLMLLCSNGTNYFQSTLGFAKDTLSLKDVEQEEWYQDMMEDDLASVYFVPRYRSDVLQRLFPEDTLFAVQDIRNLNSGRQVGILILASDQITWGSDSKNHVSDENSIVIDQYGRVIFPLSDDFNGEDFSQYAYYSEIKESQSGFFRAGMNQKECDIYFSDIQGTDWKLIYYEPYKQAWSLYALLTGLLGLVSLAAIAVMAVFNCNFIYRRMKRINDNILEVSKGNLQTRIRENYEVEFNEICNNFNTMLDRIEDLVTQLETEEKEKFALEFQSLQAQINSHFFYNTLATVRFMIQIGEYQDADRTLIAFSKLLRKSFADSRRITSLKEELEMVEEYMELMSLRYQGRFLWRISVTVDKNKIGILKNTIQPLVENSISHGFNMKEDTGHIQIRVYQEKDSVIVEVEDDGVGADLDKINTCIHNQYIPKVRDQFSEIGLSNIQMRITRNFGEEYGLTASLNQSNGVTLRMKLPLIGFYEEAKLE